MRYLFWMIVFGFSITVFSTAQPREGFGEGRKHASERLESYKKVRMIEALNLDEKTGVKLISRYTDHRNSVKKLEKERGEVMDKLDVQVQSTAGDGEFKKSFNELFEIERKITDARKKYLDELKEIFSTRQIAEYLIFERNFMKDLRNVVNDVQRQRMRRN